MSEEMKIGNLIKVLEHQMEKNPLENPSNVEHTVPFVFPDGSKQNCVIKAPVDWTYNAVFVAATRWFRGKLGDATRETSVKNMIYRVADAIATFGSQTRAYTADFTDNFTTYLALMQANQYMAFNTPVYLNAGWSKDPRCSACFLLFVDDTYESLTEYANLEGLVFQHGGGAGLSLDNISHEGYALSHGGFASGPLSFNEGWDRSSGAIKSGGSHRRAARDVTCSVTHPDCYRNKEYLATLPGSPLDADFIREKQIYEHMRRDLIAAGWPNDFNGIVNYALPGQNANRSVGIPDDFMDQVMIDRTWDVKCPRTGAIVWTYKAREIWDAIVDAAWDCGDPTVKFLDTINAWNTTPNHPDFRGMKINKSNPCNEVLVTVPPIPRTMAACNLAMLRVSKYLTSPDTFDIDLFKTHIQATVIAQDIIIDYSSYPNQETEDWVKSIRIIGLGISDLGGLLMRAGFGYGTKSGRVLASAVSAFLFAEAAMTSTRLAEEYGPCPSYELNKEAVKDVWEKHADAIRGAIANKEFGVTAGNVVVPDFVSVLLDSALDTMRDAIFMLEESGVRNMQLVSYAPNGTTGVVTDCDSTGVEPVFSPNPHKTLSGGGAMEFHPECMKVAITNIVSDSTDNDLVEVSEKGTLRGVVHQIFATAMGAKNGSNALKPQDHLNMLIALQGFVSGSISKTINLPASTTREEIAELYMNAWTEDIKNIAIYRDGCKSAQPLNTTRQKEANPKSTQSVVTTNRQKLPETCIAIRKKLVLDQHEIYLHIGLYPNGMPGEIFMSGITGSLLSGMLDSFAVGVSNMLQRGVPFEEIYKMYAYREFQPNGWVTGLGHVQSFPSYVMKVLKQGIESGEFKRISEAAKLGETVTEINNTPLAPEKLNIIAPVAAGHSCPNCQSTMVQSGRCWSCPACGESSGGCG